MLAFMAYPPPRNRQNSSNSITANTSNHTTSTTSCHSAGHASHDRGCNDSVTTASMDERPPQSVLSLSTEASSAILLEEQEEEEVQRRAQNCCADNNPRPEPQPRRRNTTQMYFDRIYENTVHGSCQPVTMCEIEHMDLFLNCQQPFSFLGFGHHPIDPSFHGNNPHAHESTNLSYHLEEEMLHHSSPPEYYAVPRGCEYCGAPTTRDCDQQCSRPRQFFHKKRPPFAPPDSSKWDPDTELAVRTGTSPRSQPLPHTQRN